MRSMPSDEGFYSCSIFFQLVRDRYVKMLLARMAALRGGLNWSAQHSNL
jgi:hypothetical protein